MLDMFDCRVAEESVDKLCRGACSLTLDGSAMGMDVSDARAGLGSVRLIIPRQPPIPACADDL